MNPTLFTAFLLITAVLIVAPGPIVTLVISTGATQGVRAALTTVAGTTVGNVLLLATIAIGLNWVVAHAGLLFEALRWTGAAYLVWLGVQAWRNAGRTGDELRDSGRRRFLRGLVVALSNPKTIVFFTAFLPQFLDPGLACRAAACGDVRRVRVDGRSHRFGLGNCRRPRARVAHEASARQAAQAADGERAHRRRDLAHVGAPPELRAPALSCRSKGASMADAATLQDLDQRIAVIRDNLRALTEQAAAVSGAEDEARAADRIADQQRALEALLKQREALEKQRAPRS